MFKVEASAFEGSSAADPGRGTVIRTDERGVR